MKNEWSILCIEYFVLSIRYTRSAMTRLKPLLIGCSMYWRDSKLKARQPKKQRKRNSGYIPKTCLMKLNFPSALWRATEQVQSRRARRICEIFEQFWKNQLDKKSGLLERKSNFYKESMLSRHQAEIQTKIVTASKEIPIYYRRS